MHQLDPALEPMTRKERRELRRLERRGEGTARKQGKLFKRALVWGIAALVLVAIGWLAWRAAQRPSVSGTLSVPVGEQDNVRGPSDAPVTLVEYSDFQCPACATFHPIITQILSEAPFAQNIRFVYRHFPLTNIHRNALLAARAAQAAALQGKFWEMHDAIFEAQETWSAKSDADARTVFASIATGLGLAVAQWESDVDSEAIAARVDADIASAQSSAVTGTPSFFVNGVFADVFSSNDVVGAFREALTNAINANP